MLLSGVLGAAVGVTLVGATVAGAVIVGAGLIAFTACFAGVGVFAGAFLAATFLMTVFLVAGFLATIFFLIVVIFFALDGTDFFSTGTIFVTGFLGAFALAFLAACFIKIEVDLSAALAIAIANFKSCFI